MSPSTHLAGRIADLVQQRMPYVQATVVRAQCPTSARPGDAAIVLPDGSIEGFVGGQCAESSVRVAALQALDSGEAVLLRIVPDDEEPFPDSPGARTVVNPCLSGGALEVFLEPKRPAARLVVVGNTPIAGATVTLAAPLGFDVVAMPAGIGEDPGNVSPGAQTIDPGELVGATAVVLATHGRAEAETIRAALDAGVGFVGLVASRRRAASVLAEALVTAAEQHRVHSPVGIAIGARTAEEIALSVLAEIVRAVRLEGLEAAAAAVEPVRPATAVDPVCGMTVIVDADTPHLRRGGVDHWFCNPGCRARFAEEHP